MLSSSALLTYLTYSIPHCTVVAYHTHPYLDRQGRVPDPGARAHFGWGSLPFNQSVNQSNPRSGRQSEGAEYTA
ncbi:hypothetical protein HOY80DRAFT_958302 [Tuber brumale]|nr:hypothetical protein HOY80DRAFT_958302 [Tuber brumale]